MDLGTHNFETEITPINFIDNNSFKDCLSFKSNGILSLGVEIELQLINPQNLELSPRAEAILNFFYDSPKIKPECYLSTIELNTDKCATVHEVEEDLLGTFTLLRRVTNKLNIQLSSTGVHPFSKYEDCLISDNERYQNFIYRNQWLTRRLAVYGLHVHLGMSTGDDCIRFNNFFMYFLPHFLSITSSSPFWKGMDTGLASCRPTTYESLPTAGQPYFVTKWSDFEKVYHALKKSEAISSTKDLWWDLRPNPVYGTLEIRVCDSPATMYEILAVTAYIHTLAHWFMENENRIESIYPSWLLRENKWRAIRHGLSAKLVVNAEGKTQLLADDIKAWLKRLKPYYKKLGYERYMNNLLMIIKNGTSSDRQRKILNQSKSYKDVVNHNISELTAQYPLWM